jgi:two-component system, sensor histidine kinase and response regulator
MGWLEVHMNNILIAEDNPLNLKIMHLLLDGFGLDADDARNGKEAVAAAITKPYEIILMDIMMPEMDGLDATRLIREIEDKSPHRAIIVAVTALYKSKDECIEAGMDDFISKPINKEILRTSIFRWLGTAIPA